jgi:hypothetical protein
MLTAAGGTRGCYARRAPACGLRPEYPSGGEAGCVEAESPKALNPATKQTLEQGV